MEENIQALWDSYKRYNPWVMGIPEGEERNGRNIWNNKSREFSKINETPSHRSILAINDINTVRDERREENSRKIPFALML